MAKVLNEVKSGGIVGKSKVAIVTGASRGIGKQVALQLASAGFDVAVVARSLTSNGKLPGSLNETVEEIKATGQEALALSADLSSLEDLHRIVNETINVFGRLDVLVNGAAFTSGRGWGAPLEELSFESWREQYATNLDAPFVLMKEAVPYLRQVGGGVMINITSGAAELVSLSGGPGSSIMGTGPLAYSSSKAALNRLTNVLAPQLAADNICVVNVEPGFVRTEMVEAMGQKGAPIEESIPMSIPTNVIVAIVTDADPIRFTGQIISAEGFQA